MSEELYDNANAIRVQRGELEQAAQIGAPMSRVATNYQTTVGIQKARNLREVEALVVEEAEIAGSSCYFSWEVSNKDGTKGLIEGISIDGAMILHRNWGHAAVQMREVQEVHGAVIFTAAWIDHERDSSIERQFKLSNEFPVYGEMDQYRKEDIRFQIGQSKAIRNVILAGMPAYLKDRLLLTAKKGEMDKLRKFIADNGGPEAGKEKVTKIFLAKLAKAGVTEERVLAKMGRPTPQALTLEDLVLLKGNIDAIKSQQESVDTLFPPIEKEGSEGSRSRTSQVMESLGADEEEAPKGSEEAEGSEEPADQQPESDQSAPPTSENGAEAKDKGGKGSGAKKRGRKRGAGAETETPAPSTPRVTELPPGAPYEGILATVYQELSYRANRLAEDPLGLFFAWDSESDAWLDAAGDDETAKTRMYAVKNHFFEQAAADGFPQDAGSGPQSEA